MQKRIITAATWVCTIGLIGCADAGNNDRHDETTQLGDPISEARFEPLDRGTMTLQQTTSLATGSTLCAACTTSTECGSGNYCLQRSDGVRFCGSDCRARACPSGYSCVVLSPTISQCVPPRAQCDVRDAGVSPDAGVPVDAGTTPDAGAPSSGDVPTTPHCAAAASWSANDARDEAEVLRLSNLRRQAGASCGGVSYAPAPALTMVPALRCAARLHSSDMNTRNYFSHTTPEGVSFSTRIDQAGYSWRNIGENIASGYLTPQAVVDGWMNSPGHCQNIMNPSFTQIGVGRAGNLWTQDFGAPL